MLRDAQKTIAEWIRAPEGVASALAEADTLLEGGMSGSASQRLDALIRSDESLDARGRLEIYANAYFHRIHGVLCDDFPALRSAIGAAGFHDLVTSYLLVEPSRHPSLRYAGERLAGFLTTHDAASGIRARAPWAPALAEFEWARVDVFDAPDLAHASRASLASLAPEAFATLELRLGPWVRLLSSTYPIDRLWREAMRDAPEENDAERRAQEEEQAQDHEPSRIGDVAADPTSWIVWRKDEAVVHRPVSAFEAVALRLVFEGVRFDRVCESAASAYGDREAPAQAAIWLEQWLGDGLLIDSSGD